MRVSPISFLQQKVAAAPAPSYPLAAESIHRYEEVYTNQSTSTTVTDLVTGNNNLNLNGVSTTINSNQYIQTSNTATSPTSRNSLIYVNVSNALSGNRDAYSFILLEEHEDDTVFTSISDNIYFADFRSLSSWFGSYMTDKDSIQTGGKFDGGDMFVYVPGNAVFTGSLTPSNWSDGVGTIGGGDDYYQWIGNSPASRGATGFRRLWGINIPTANVFNTNTNAGRYSLYGGFQLSQGASGKIWAHALFDTHLTSTTFGQLITYYQGLGYIT